MCVLGARCRYTDVSPRSLFKKNLLPNKGSTVSRSPLAVSSFGVYLNCRDSSQPRWCPSRSSPDPVTECGGVMKCQSLCPDARHYYVPEFLAKLAEALLCLNHSSLSRDWSHCSLPCLSRYGLLVNIQSLKLHQNLLLENSVCNSVCISK